MAPSITYTRDASGISSFHHERSIVTNSLATPAVKAPAIKASVKEMYVRLPYNFGLFIESASKELSPELPNPGYKGAHVSAPENRGSNDLRECGL